MVDFWAILGHAATDDRFRDHLYDAFEGREPVADPNRPDNIYACMFETGDYEALRRIVVPRIGPVSLMALGEWLMVAMLRANKRASFDKLAGTVQEILQHYLSLDPAFYQALGGIMIDPDLRDAFAADNEGTYGFQLGSVDRNRLAALVAEQDFKSLASRFHDDTWDCSCGDMCLQWEPFPYAHPLDKTLAQMLADLRSSTAAPQS